MRKASIPNASGKVRSSGKDAARMLPRKELQRKPVVWQAGGGSVQTAACKMPFGMLKLKQLREDTIRGFTPAAPLKQDRQQWE